MFKFYVNLSLLILTKPYLFIVYYERQMHYLIVILFFPKIWRKKIQYILLYIHTYPRGSSFLLPIHISDVACACADSIEISSGELGWRSFQYKVLAPITSKSLNPLCNRLTKRRRSATSESKACWWQTHPTH